MIDDHSTVIEFSGRELVVGSMLNFPLIVQFKYHTRVRLSTWVLVEKYYVGSIGSAAYNMRIRKPYTLTGSEWT